MSMRINTVHDLVRKVLEEEPVTRNSDKLLYLRLLERLDPTVTSRSFASVWVDKALPNTETVRRARQRIQHDNPELGSDENVEEMKAISEMAFRHYARGY